MTLRTAGAGRCAIALVPLVVLAACSSGPRPTPHAEIVRSELTGIIATQGSPCGQVIEYSFNDRLDYRVLCESGRRYRIRVTPVGHVEATREAASAPAPSTP